MKSLSCFVSFAILSATIVSSIPITRRDVNEALVPQFGFSAGVNPTGTGDCDGAVNGTDGQPVKVPCSCPPDRTSFIQSLNANVAAGRVLNNPSVPISFPEDNSTASQLSRINAATVTLQNLNGSGQGCPVASTTFQAQADAVNITRPQVNEFILARQSTPSLPVKVNEFILARQSTPSLPVKVNEFILARQSTPSLPVKADGFILARQSTPSPIPEISLPGLKVDGFILARQSTPSPSPVPTPSIKVDGFILARQSTPLSVPTPSIKVDGFILARQSTPSPVPTPSIKVDGFILARQSTPSPIPEISLPGLKVDGFILARQSTPSPSPSPKPEIILAGPPVIKD